ALSVTNNSPRLRFPLWHRHAMLPQGSLQAGGPMLISRRSLLKLIGLGGLAGTRIIGASVAYAEEKTWPHGLSLFGELKYPPDFPHFAYVNPDAPKGGRARLC